MNRKVKIFFSFCLTIVFLYIAFKDIDLNEFYTALKNIDWSVITLISVMTIISILIRAWRWQILLRTLKDIPYKSVFSFTIIGLMANNVLPAHAGEFIRAFYLGKREKVSVVSAFTTIFVERLFDFISIALFFL
ncbi:MAG TPA: lysylphosphatidylglycerol synthase transmembrane domain-containing protein [Thermodesulfovibrionia bacterium]|nr:lysylphosphatidylglycerol synthase transmembrane domain-containing protein [Thermodesulfovibrionia bacterium]